MAASLVSGSVTSNGGFITDVPKSPGGATGDYYVVIVGQQDQAATPPTVGVTGFTAIDVNQGNSGFPGSYWYQQAFIVPFASAPAGTSFSITGLGGQWTYAFCFLVRGASGSVITGVKVDTSGSPTSITLAGVTVGSGGGLVVVMEMDYDGGGSAPTSPTNGTWTQNMGPSNAAALYTQVFSAGATGSVQVFPVSTQRMTGLIWSFEAASTSTMDQEGARFRNDDGSETTATWAATQDANVTAPLSANLRLRALINAATGDPANTAFTLGYKKSTDSVYVPVPVGAATTLPTFVAAGTFTSGTGALSVPPPAGIQDKDVLLCVVESANEAITTPSGYAQVSNSPQGTGTGAAIGAVRVAVFAKVTNGTESNLTVADSGNHTTAVILAYRGVDNTTPVHVTNGSVDAAATTSLSAPAVTTTIANCLIVNCIGLDKDATGTNTLSSQANASLSSVSKRVDAVTASGVGGGVAVIDGGLATAGSSGATTATGDTSTTHAYVTIALAPPPRPIFVSPSANVTAGGEASTAQLAAPSGKTTGNFTTGRMWDDENGADSIDIASGNYTELEWSLQAQSPAAAADVYQFRVYAGASALDSYSVTPEWTIGSGSVDVAILVTAAIGAAATAAASRTAAIAATAPAGATATTAVSRAAPVQATVPTGATATAQATRAATARVVAAAGAGATAQAGHSPTILVSAPAGAEVTAQAGHSVAAQVAASGGAAGTVLAGRDGAAAVNAPVGAVTTAQATRAQAVFVTAPAGAVVTAQIAVASDVAVAVTAPIGATVTVQATRTTSAAATAPAGAAGTAQATRSASIQVVGPAGATATSQAQLAVTAAVVAAVGATVTGQATRTQAILATLPAGATAQVGIALATDVAIVATLAAGMTATVLATRSSDTQVAAPAGATGSAQATRTQAIVAVLPMGAAATVQGLLAHPVVATIPAGATATAAVTRSAAVAATAAIGASASAAVLVQRLIAATLPAGATVTVRAGQSDIVIIAGGVVCAVWFVDEVDSAVYADEVSASWSRECQVSGGGYDIGDQPTILFTVTPHALHPTAESTAVTITVTRPDGTLFGTFTGSDLPVTRSTDIVDIGGVATTRTFWELEFPTPLDAGSKRHPWAVRFVSTAGIVAAETTFGWVKPA